MKGGSRNSAEGQGFEPWVGGYPTTVFKTVSLGHSDSPPVATLTHQIADVASPLATIHSGVPVASPVVWASWRSSTPPLMAIYPGLISPGVANASRDGSAKCTQCDVDAVTGLAGRLVGDEGWLDCRGLQL